MATSGSWDYSRTAAQVIAAAFENLGVVIPGGTVPSAHSTMALARLNTLVKQWMGDADGFPGLHLVHRNRIVLFLAKGQQQYQVGPASTDARACSLSLLGRTTLSADEAASQTTLSITSNTDTTTNPGTTITMANTNIVGIELNDGTIHWTAISGTPASTMDVSVGITGAAAAGNYVWWFAARAQRFILCEAAVIRDENYTDTEIPVYAEVAQYELGVADKYADGQPTAILIEPLRITTRVTLNSQPTDVTEQLVLTVQYPSEDYDATSDDIAFPQEYLAALEWELAFRLAPAARAPWTQTHEANRQSALATARRLNPEMSTLHFDPGGY